jgi:hypothetical protein
MLHVLASAEYEQLVVCARATILNRQLHSSCHTLTLPKQER